VTEPRESASNVVPLRADDQWLTRRQLAERFQVSERTIDRWTNEGMPGEKWGRRTRRFQLPKVETWLRGRAA
jgi:excisionase family DNA binding protein